MGQKGVSLDTVKLYCFLSESVGPSKMPLVYDVACSCIINDSKWNWSMITRWKVCTVTRYTQCIVWGWLHSIVLSLTLESSKWSYQRVIVDIVACWIKFSSRHLDVQWFCMQHSNVACWMIEHANVWMVIRWKLRISTHYIWRIV